MRFGLRLKEDYTPVFFLIVFGLYCIVGWVVPAYNRIRACNLLEM